MNALKHGLDAQTPVLPGEDEAAYKARLEAWSIHYAPRDALESALLEQAVRLSWQVDRADRACAAHLAERIRLLQSDEHRRAQAEAEAARAAEIGEQLVADPPRPKYNLAKIHARLVRLRESFLAPFVPIFDLPSSQARLAQKRYRMPIPPDDPTHPERLLRDLHATAAGCRWLLARWGELRAGLENDSGWGPDERLRAVRLLAKLPTDAIDDPVVRMIYLCCFAMGPDDPHVFDDQARETADCEFQDLVQRMEGRGFRDSAPGSRKEAQRWLLALVDEIASNLRSRAAMHARRAEAALATDCLTFDPSPQGRRLRRLQSRLLGSLLRTINLLTKVRRRPDALFRQPDSVGAGATSREPAGECEKMRNEPNDGRSPESPAAVSTAGPVDPVRPAGELEQPAACDGSPSVGFTHPTECDRDVVPNVSGTTVCVNVRNEPIGVPVSGAPDEVGVMPTGGRAGDGRSNSAPSEHRSPTPRPWSVLGEHPTGFDPETVSWGDVQR